MPISATGTAHCSSAPSPSLVLRQRRPARSLGFGDRPVGSRDILDRLPAQPGAAWAQRRQAGDLGRARGPQDRRRPRRMPTAPAPSSARWPIGSAPRCPNSPPRWTRPKPTSSPLFPKDHRPKIHSIPPRTAEWRDQATHRSRRHPPERGRHHPPRRRYFLGGERRIGRAAGPLMTLETIAPLRGDPLVKPPAMAA
jgi:hypothetical protein